MGGGSGLRADTPLWETGCRTGLGCPEEGGEPVLCVGSPVVELCPGALAPCRRLAAGEAGGVGSLSWVGTVPWDGHVLAMSQMCPQCVPAVWLLT